jgi:hypothetical protein
MQNKLRQMPTLSGKKMLRLPSNKILPRTFMKFKIFHLRHIWIMHASITKKKYLTPDEHEQNIHQKSYVLKVKI